MLRINTIDHINMHVKDLEQSVKFYNDLFGFKEKEPDKSRGLTYKIIGTDKVHLCMYEKPDLVINGGINHFGFHIDNFDEIIQKCEELNVPILYGGPIEWAHSRSIYIQDPSGYEVELSEVKGGGL